METEPLTLGVKPCTSSSWPTAVINYAKLCCVSLFFARNTDQAKSLESIPALHLCTSHISYRYPETTFLNIALVLSDIRTTLSGNGTSMGGLDGKSISWPLSYSLSHFWIMVRCCHEVTYLSLPLFRWVVHPKESSSLTPAGDSWW